MAKRTHGFDTKKELPEGLGTGEGRYKANIEHFGGHEIFKGESFYFTAKNRVIKSLLIAK